MTDIIAHSCAAPDGGELGKGENSDTTWYYITNPALEGGRAHYKDGDNQQSTLQERKKT